MTPDPPRRLGPYPLNTVVAGDCLALAPALPPDSVAVIVTSPPYWGQRVSAGTGVEADPRAWLATLVRLFGVLRDRLAPDGVAWVNVGDAYDTPVNWRLADRDYSTLGPDRGGLAPDNTAYLKPRARRRAFVDPSVPWLRYGNLLALPYRLVIALCDDGWLFRGEVVWRKKNPLPEGRCRRPHRAHEGVYLLARREDHAFRAAPPVRSVWDLGNERVPGPAHYSRFPEELPTRCIDAFGRRGREVVVLDPFAGSGTTGVAALRLGCSFLGFEIDPAQAAAANDRLARL